MRRQRCPICGDPTSSALGQVSFAGKTEYSSHQIELELVPEIWKCLACGSWFTQNAVPQEISQALYASGSSGERWTAEVFEKAKLPELIAEVDRHVTTGTRLLDVGCSSGQLLDYAKSRGAETWGMDFSTDCGRVITGKGHRFVSSLADLGAQRFEVVTAFDVIEHLYDAPSFLEDVARLLGPGGKLIVLTGDIASLSARLCGSRWWYLRYPEHIVFPSRRFFRGEPAGFKLERIVRTYASAGYRESPLQVARRALSLLIRRAYEGLPALGPDHMLVVLRRA